MDIPKNNDHLEKARALRKNMTLQERKLWYTFLQHYPVKIYKQRIIGNYIVDFYCAAANLVIEIDGSQHYEDKGRSYDRNRDDFLEKLGLKILRISNREVNNRFRSVCEYIDNEIQTRTRKV